MSSPNLQGEGRVAPNLDSDGFCEHELRVCVLPSAFCNGACTLVARQSRQESQ